MPFDDALIWRWSRLQIEQQPSQFHSIGQSFAYFSILAVNSLKTTGCSDPTSNTLQNLISFYSFLEQ